MERANTNKQRDGMALSASRLRPSRTDSEPDPVVSDLPKLADDAEYITLTERKNVLRRAHAARQAQFEIRAIDAELKRGATSQNGPRASLLRERRAMLLASLPQPAEAHAVSDDQVGLHPTVILGLRLTSGEKLPEASDSSGEASRLQQEMNALDMAIRQLDCELDEVRADRSAAVARSLWDQHCSILLSKLNAAMALSAAASAERQLIASMISAGYTMQPGILLSPRLDTAETLGNPSRMDSPIARYRQALELAGVL